MKEVTELAELVSVIIPVYKVEKYLKKCVDSVLRQTYTDIEIILVDDGSPDSCGAICDSYMSEDARVRVIHKENGGLSSARNAGIDIAKGSYLYFLDSDDYIENNTIELLLGELRHGDAQMCICNIDYVDENGCSLESLNLSSPIVTERLSKPELFNKLIQKACWYYIPAWNKLYKKEIIGDLRFPEGKQHEDEFFVHLVIDNCNKICCVSNRLYHYVQRSGSIMSSSVSIKRLDGLEALLGRTDFFINRDYYDEAVGTLNTFAKLYCIIIKKASDETVIDLARDMKKQAYQIFSKPQIQNCISWSVKNELRLFFSYDSLYGVYIKVKRKLLGD